MFFARELTAVDREMHGEEEADLVISTVTLDEAVRMALAGELRNGPTVAGVLAAQAVLSGGADPRPADAAWSDRPSAFTHRSRR